MVLVRAWSVYIILSALLTVLITSFISIEIFIGYKQRHYKEIIIEVLIASIMITALFSPILFYLNHLRP